MREKFLDKEKKFVLQNTRSWSSLPFLMVNSNTEEHY